MQFRIEDRIGPTAGNGGANVDGGNYDRVVGFDSDRFDHDVDGRFDGLPYR